MALSDENIPIELDQRNHCQSTDQNSSENNRLVANELVQEFNHLAVYEEKVQKKHLMDPAISSSTTLVVDVNDNGGVCNENCDHSTKLKNENCPLDESSEYAEIRLDTIPIEVFLHICSFIDSGFLLQNVSLVCKHFYTILSNEKTWKIRQEKRWGRNGVYPPVAVDENSYSWSRACWKREEQIKLWANNGENVRTVQLKSHIACVDAVHLFDSGKFLATGSRDRSIIIWDVEKAFEDPVMGDKNNLAQGAVARSVAKVHENGKAHDGWIWSFTSNQNNLLSASWDNTVRIWDKKGDFRLVAELPTERVACLCLATTPDGSVVACGTYDKKVLLFDPRDSARPVPLTTYQVHKKCVLALGMDDTRIISCSEDGRTILYDMRAQKVVKTIKLSNGAYPTCLSFRHENPAPLFYIGDRLGQIHLVNSDLFEIVKTYDVGHKQIVQGVFHSLGSVMTCSSDGLLKIMEPSSGLNELASLKIDAELPGVHSWNNTTVLAGGDSVVRLFNPIEGF